MIALCLGAFALGSIPFGVIVSGRRGLDIRKVGSGNIGATNVHRALGWKFGLLVMFLDAAKGLVPALLAASLGYGPNWALLAGLAAVAGHCFSPLLNFKGGKGIATLCGAALGATPLVAAGGLLVFAILFLSTQYVSVASIAAVGAAVLISWLLNFDAAVVATFGLLWIFIIYRHRANIARLVRREEPKTTLKGGSKNALPKAEEITIEEPAQEAQEDTKVL